MKTLLRICLCAAAVLACVAARAADDLPPCDKNHFILPFPCKLLAVDAPIGAPGAVTVDPSGNLYFSSPSIVYRIDSQGWLVHVAGTGNHGFSGDGGPATEAQLNFPAMYPELELWPTEFLEFLGGIAVDASGQVYIADAYNNRIRIVDAQGVIHTFADENQRTTVWWPQGVAVDATGNVYVTGQYGSLVKFPVDGPPQMLADFPTLVVPEGIALAPDGTIYVAQAGCSIKMVRPDSTVLVAAMGCGRLSWQGGDDALVAPYSVALDTAGTLYIADTWNNCIRKVEPGTRIKRTIAGRCGYRMNGFSGDGGPARDALFDHPHGIAVDAIGNVYVADTRNHRIRRIDTDGVITTIAGSGNDVPVREVTP